MAITEISLSTQALDGTLIPAKVSTNPSDTFLFPGEVDFPGPLYITYDNTSYSGYKNLSVRDTVHGGDALFLGTNFTTGTGNYSLLDSYVSPLSIRVMPATTLTLSDTTVATITDPSAIVRIESTTQGFLTPRMTTVQRDAITSPTTGLQIYNTDTVQPEIFNGTAWVSMAPALSFGDDTFTAASTGTGQTFTLSNTPITNSAVVNHNGLVLRPTVDYTIAGTTLTIVENVNNGDSIQAIYTVSIGGSPTTTPGGGTGDIQFNSSGSFAGNDTFMWDDINHNLNITHASDGLGLSFNTAGSSGVYVEFLSNDSTGQCSVGVGNADPTPDGHAILELHASHGIQLFSNNGNYIWNFDNAGILRIDNTNLALQSTNGDVTITTGSGGHLRTTTGTFDWSEGADSLTVSTLITSNFQLTTTPTSGYVLTSDASGIGTWQAPSGGAITFSTISTNFTLSAAGYYLVNNGGGNVDVTLPPASGFIGQTIYLKANASGQAFNLIPDGSDQIDGINSQYSVNQFESVIITSDGTNWITLTSSSLSNAFSAALGAFSVDTNGVMTASAMNVAGTQIDNSGNIILPAGFLKFDNDSGATIQWHLSDGTTLIDEITANPDHSIDVITGTQFRINTNNDSTPLTWTFDTNGNLTAPGGLLTTGLIKSNIVIITSASYSVLDTDYTVCNDATLNIINIALPAASAVPGRLLNFKKTDSSANAVNVNRAGSDLIDGQTSVPLTAQYQTVSIQSDGTNWNIL